MTDLVPTISTGTDPECHSSQFTEQRGQVFLLGASNKKGQDFPSTIQDDPLLSLFMPVADQTAWAEERRLFYVAITRARDELYLTYPHMRLSGGYGDIFQRPSRFLKEIPSELVEDWQVRKG